MLDTTRVTTAITKLIAAGVAEGELVAMVARQFPELDPRDFVAALHVATTAAERLAVRRH